MAAELPSDMTSAIEVPSRATVHLGNARLFVISAMSFALSALWGALLTLVVPIQVEDILRRSGMAPDQIVAYKSSALGLVVASGAIVALVVPPFIGALSDRCTLPLGRRRPYIIGGILITLGGLVGMVTPPSLLVYGAAYLVVQAGSNAAVAAYSGFIPDLVPHEQRGHASGWLGMMVILGNITGLLLGSIGLALQPGQYLLTSGQQVLVYGAIGAILLGFLLITVIFVHETPLPGPVQRPGFLRILRSLWIDPRKFPDFGWVWITRFLMTMGFNTVQFFLLYFLEDVVGIPDSDKTTYAAYLYLGLLLSAAFASIVGGRISDRTGRKPTIYVAGALMSLMAAAFIIFSLAGTVPLPGFFSSAAFNTIIFIALGFGIGYGSYMAVDWALGTDVLPNKDTDAAKDLGVWHIAMVLPQSLATIISGWLLTLTTNVGMPAGLRYSLVFGVAIVYFVLGTVLVRNVRGTR
jgi:MFS family permease